ALCTMTGVTSATRQDSVFSRFLSERPNDARGHPRADPPRTRARSAVGRRSVLPGHRGPSGRPDLGRGLSPLARLSQPSGRLLRSRPPERSDLSLRPVLRRGVGLLPLSGHGRDPAGAPPVFAAPGRGPRVFEPLGPGDAAGVLVFSSPGQPRGRPSGALGLAERIPYFFHLRLSEFLSECGDVPGDPGALAALPRAPQPPQVVRASPRSDRLVFLTHSRLRDGGPADHCVWLSRAPQAPRASALLACVHARGLLLSPF